MTDIFLSYARVDRDRIEPIVSMLENEGWTVWWDTKISGGERWDATIESKLESAACVIVVWSSSSITSQWVRTEASEGHRRGILVPISFDGVEAPLAFRLLQTIDLDPFIETSNATGFDQLREAVHQFIEPTPAPAPLPTPPPIPNAPLVSPILTLQDDDRVGRLGAEEKASPKTSRRWMVLSGIVVLSAVAMAVVAGFYTKWPPSLSDLKPLSTFKDCAACPEMVVIPPGRFEIVEHKFKKDETDVRRSIAIGHRFAIGRTEVTNELYAKFLSDLVREGNFDPGLAKTTFDSSRSRLLFSVKRVTAEAGYQKHPVIDVSWRGARAYAEWLSKQTGRTYRLPSETEWEYAARAGDKKDFLFDGKNADKLCAYANTPDRAARRVRRTGYILCDDGYPNLAPVGRFKANPFKLYDTIGNAWEWTMDCFVAGVSSTPSNGAPYIQDANCSDRVIKGGAYDNQSFSYSVKYKHPAKSTIKSLGFRLVRELP